MMKFLVFVCVAVELIALLLCQDFHEFNSTFATLNVTFLNGESLGSECLNRPKWIRSPFCCLTDLRRARTYSDNGFCGSLKRLPPRIYTVEAPETEQFFAPFIGISQEKKCS